MKKNKILAIALITTFTMTGCFKRDTMDNIDIYTTTYPINYLVENIYGYNSNVKSIYPAGVEVKNYELTNKQEKDYAEKDMFVYNGLTEEKQIAATFLGNNKYLKVIDVGKGISIQRDQE